MANRRRITPEERRTVYSLTGGKCAYCGKPLPFLDMQVDHVVPLHQGGADEAFNMLPSCRSCNHYKRGMSLEKWRSQLEAIPATLERDCYTYCQGARFGMVAPTPHKVVFYFEKIDREDAQKGEVVDPIGNYQGTPLEWLDAFQRQLKRFDIPSEKIDRTEAAEHG